MFLFIQTRYFPSFFRDLYNFLLTLTVMLTLMIMLIIRCVLILLFVLINIFIGLMFFAVMLLSVIFCNMTLVVYILQHLCSTFVLIRMI